tara:strand:- start:4378 stop:4704 length:327 start_codon:yes stop_codon:yes gene_type:complete
MKSDLYKIKVFNRETQTSSDEEHHGQVEDRGNLIIHESHSGKEGTWTIAHKHTGAAIAPSFLSLSLSQARRICRKVKRWSCWKRKSVKAVRNAITEGQLKKLKKELNR